MITKLYKQSSNRLYSNGNLVNGIDITGEFSNLHKPRVSVRVYKPKQLTNKAIRKEILRSSRNPSIFSALKSLKNNTKFHKKQRTIKRKKRNTKRKKRNTKRKKRR